MKRGLKWRAEERNKTRDIKEIILTRLIQIELRTRQKTMSSILVRTNGSLADPLPTGATIVTITIFLLFMLLTMIINFNFTIYHLYMRKKPEFSNRLLNVLYSFHACLLQFGSFLILLILCDNTMDNNTFRHFIPSTELLVTIRMLHLSCVFINIFYIGMATLIQNFKMDLYLLISMRIDRKIICSTTFVISILLNILLKYQLKEKENDIKELEKYQSVIKRVCSWLNMMALTMCLLVILKNIIFYIKKYFSNFLGHARDYLLWKRNGVTPIFRIDIEMGQMVNHVVLEQPHNNNVNNNVIIQSIGIEEHIRWVLIEKFLHQSNSYLRFTLD